MSSIGNSSSSSSFLGLEWDLQNYSSIGNYQKFSAYRRSFHERSDVDLIAELKQRIKSCLDANKYQELPFFGFLLIKLAEKNPASNNSSINLLDDHQNNTNINQFNTINLEPENISNQQNDNQNILIDYSIPGNSYYSVELLVIQEDMNEAVVRESEDSYTSETEKILESDDEDNESVMNLDSNNQNEILDKADKQEKFYYRHACFKKDYEGSQKFKVIYKAKCHNKKTCPEIKQTHYHAIIRFNKDYNFTKAYFLSRGGNKVFYTNTILSSTMANTIKLYKMVKISKDSESLVDYDDNESLDNEKFFIYPYPNP